MAELGKDMTFGLFFLNSVPLIKPMRKNYEMDWNKSSLLMN